MAKYNPKKLSLKHRDLLICELSLILFTLSSAKDIKNFLKDLLSESEQVMLSRRFQIAKLLLRGLSYADIKEKLKVGDATIVSVKHFLDFGWGGYMKAISKKKKF